jgi:hypothetical protein
MIVDLKKIISNNELNKEEEIFQLKSKYQSIINERKEEEEEKAESIQDAMNLIESLENEMKQKRIELTKTKNEVIQMKKSVSIADTAAAAMARDREDAVTQLKQLKSIISEKQNAEKKEILEKAAKDSTAITTLVKKCSISCQTINSSLPLPCNENGSSSLSSSGNNVNNDFLLTLKKQLREREEVILRQSEWREEHMDKEVSFANDIRNLRREKKELKKKIKESSKKMPFLTESITTMVSIESQKNAGTSPPQERSIEREMPTLTESATTVMAIEPIKKIAIVTASTFVQTEQQQPLVEKNVQNIKDNGSSEEAIVLRHALRKLQEELSQIRIDYDTEYGTLTTTKATKANKAGTTTSKTTSVVTSSSKQASFLTPASPRIVLGELN